LALSADKTQCPHFGLEVAQPIRTASLGLVGELMRNAPTMGVALQDFAADQLRDSYGSIAYLLADADPAVFGYAVDQPDVAAHRVICDASALAAFNLVCELARPDLAPVVEVLFSTAAPLDLAPYRRSFDVPLRFNAGQTAIVLPRRFLDQPVAGADAGRRKILERQVRALRHDGELDTVTQLRRLLRVALLSGKVPVDGVSAQLGMSRRTLHRRLNPRGLRFQKVLDETRCEFAQHLLSHTRLGAGEIGLIVGYTDPSAFTRRFIRWTGVPPSEWRSNFVQSGSLKVMSTAGASGAKQ
jgi:AraC-like DNA-binding protein